MPEIDSLIDLVRQHSKLVVADDFEITAQRLLSEGRRFRNGKETRKDTQTAFWISLRLSNRKQPGRASTVFTGKESIQRLVESAYLSSERSKPDPWFRFPIWKAIAEGAEIMDEEPRWDTLHSKLASAPEIFDEHYEHWDIETHIVRKSEKLQRKSRRQLHSSHTAIMTHGDHGYFWLREERAQPAPLIEREVWLEELLREAEGQKQSAICAATGPAMMVFSPRVMAMILRKLAPWYHADSFQEGVSPLVHSRDKFSPAITLIDDGKLVAPFDLEGAPTQHTVLVDKGQQKSLLFDTYSATRDNRMTTGNFWRQTHSPMAGISHSNFYVHPAKRTLKQLVAEMADGYLLESLDSIEPARSETEFSLVGSGWKIFGSTAEPVRNVRLTIDLLELLQRAVAAADNLSFYGLCGSPSILFQDLPIGS